MKKIISITIILIMLFTTTTNIFAENTDDIIFGDTFYWKKTAQIEEFYENHLEAIISNDSSRFTYTVLKYREKFDEQKLSHNFDELFAFRQWSPQEFIELLKSDDIIKSINEKQPDCFMLPCYYDGEIHDEHREVFYKTENDKGKKIIEHLEWDRRQSIAHTTYYTNHRYVEKYLSENNITGYEIINVVHTSPFDFAIAKKDGQIFVIYLEIQTFEKYTFDTEFYKAKADLIDKKVLTISQAIDFVETYDKIFRETVSTYIPSNQVDNTSFSSAFYLDKTDDIEYFFKATKEYRDLFDKEHISRFVVENPEDYDEQKVSHNIDNLFPEHDYETGEFLEILEKEDIIKSIFNKRSNHYIYPLYYDGELLSYREVLEPEKNYLTNKKFLTQHIGNSYPTSCFTTFTNIKDIEAFLIKNNITGYKIITTITVAPLNFALAEKDGELFFIFLSKDNNEESKTINLLYDKKPELTNDKVLTISETAQLIKTHQKVEEEYVKEKGFDKDGNTTTETESFPWEWVILGSIVLVAIISTSVLIVIKKKKNK